MSHPTVLLIDHDAACVAEARRSLEAAGYHVESAADGAAGVDLFHRLRPDLVVVEALVPAMHGFEVCQAIKRSPEGEGTPVFLTSSVYRGEEARQKARRNFGCDEYIEKPFAADALVDACRRSIESALNAETNVEGDSETDAACDGPAPTGGPDDPEAGSDDEVTAAFADLATELAELADLDGDPVDADAPLEPLEPLEDLFGASSGGSSTTDAALAVDEVPADAGSPATDARPAEADVGAAEAEPGDAGVPFEARASADGGDSVDDEDTFAPPSTATASAGFGFVGVETTPTSDSRGFDLDLPEWDPEFPTEAADENATEGDREGDGKEADPADDDAVSDPIHALAPEATGADEASPDGERRGGPGSLRWEDGATPAPAAQGSASPETSETEPPPPRPVETTPPSRDDSVELEGMTAEELAGRLDQVLANFGAPAPAELTATADALPPEPPEEDLAVARAVPAAAPVAPALRATTGPDLETVLPQRGTPRASRPSRRPLPWRPIAIVAAATVAIAASVVGGRAFFGKEGSESAPAAVVEPSRGPVTFEDNLARMRTAGVVDEPAVGTVESSASAVRFGESGAPPAAAPTSIGSETVFSNAVETPTPSTVDRDGTADRIDLSAALRAETPTVAPPAASTAPRAVTPPPVPVTQPSGGADAEPAAEASAPPVAPQAADLAAFDPIATEPMRDLAPIEYAATAPEPLARDLGGEDGEAGRLPVEPAPRAVRRGDLVPLQDVDVAPALKKRVAPSYHPIARNRGDQGNVIVRVLVGENGRVDDVEILREIPGSPLNESAVRAVRRWVYEPATKDGVVVRVWKTESIAFRL